MARSCQVSELWRHKRFYLASFCPAMLVWVVIYWAPGHSADHCAVSSRTLQLGTVLWAPEKPDVAISADLRVTSQSELSGAPAAPRIPLWGRELWWLVHCVVPPRSRDYKVRRPPPPRGDSWVSPGCAIRCHCHSEGITGRLFRPHDVSAVDVCKR